MLQFKIFREDAIEQLYEYVPQEVFPEEYGGKAEPISKIHGKFMIKMYRNIITFVKYLR